MSISNSKDNPLKDKNKLESTIKLLPHTSGCYLFRDNDNNIIYVGKSKNIRNRVKSYFSNSSDHSPRIKLMIMQIKDIEVILTDNESEALTLESNLIKTNQPYFNILLKDDKKYPYVCITWSEDYPRIFITRRRRHRNNTDKYYGPYVDVNLLRNTLNIIKKTFIVRQRSIPLYKDRTCLNYDIGLCPGVCQKIISPVEYKQTIKNISYIFQGRVGSLKDELEKKMNSFSEDFMYEKAAVIRDQINALLKISENQKMSIPDSSISRDVINLSINKNICSVQIFQMRAGRLVNRLGYIYDCTNLLSDELLDRIIEQHYSLIDSFDIPPEILIPYATLKTKILESWLSSIRGNKTKINIPKRSDKAKLLLLVKKNAELELTKTLVGQQKSLIEVEDLAEILTLDNLPRRIEGYDISHISGSNAVGSQVVFINGIPSKQDYRRYSIKSPYIITGHNDDYLALKEVIERRFRRWSQLKKAGLNISDVINKKTSKLDPIILSDWPDLIMIDGGKGQLNSVMNSLKNLDLDSDINICSIAKKEEEIFIYGRKEPLSTDKSQPALLLLRKLRNEAHRFALSFHRTKRSNSMTRSYLVDIPGVGPKRIKSLLTHFKSIKAIQLASVEDISKVEGIGTQTALIIWNYFNDK